MSQTFTLRDIRPYHHVLFAVSMLLLFAWCHAETFEWMYIRFTGPDTYYSHGFLVPIISGFFIWRRRSIFRVENFEVSYTGLALMLAGCVIHLLGTILYVFSISGFSIWIFILGLTLFLFGWSVTKNIGFPLFFLLFMFPLPEAFISLISFPLKMLVAKLGTDMVGWLGIPVYREGFNISIPAGTLVVGNPCSGLRSLIAFLALGATFAHLLDVSTWKKAVLFLSAIPVAVLSNLVRVPILIVVSYYFGLESAAPDTMVHTGSGIFVFAIGLVMIYGLSRVLEWQD